MSKATLLSMVGIVTVVGTRPEFIRASVVSRLIREEFADRMSETLVNTGQHYDRLMSGIFFEELGLPGADVDLGVGSGSHAEQTAAILVPLERLLKERRPDIVVVHGDTNSTLAGTIAATKLKVPVAHVEAGLRSGDPGMAEEQNRIVADHLSTIRYCPTVASTANLKREGITEGVKLIGDLSLDAHQAYVSLLERRPERLRMDLPSSFCLLTLHRAETTDDPARLRSIFEAINRLDNLTVLFPVHPRTRKALRDSGISLGSHIRLMDPVGFLEMLVLESRCSFILTDSGGVQKEAYFWRKPCVTLRDTTEWVETVETGWNRVVGTAAESIIEGVRSLRAPHEHPALYGDGETAGRLVRDLLGELNND